jgi:hypothetical protein
VAVTVESYEKVLHIELGLHFDLSTRPFCGHNKTLNPDFIIVQKDLEVISLLCGSLGITGKPNGENEKGHKR